MIKVNDIVELNSIEYRVIQLFGCLALILPMKGQSVDLISMDADDLNDGLLKGTVLLKKDPWIDIQYRKLTDVMLKTAKENYELIKSIISTPDLYKLNGRKRLVQAYSKGDKHLERRMNMLIGNYWRRGQSIYSLVPDYGKNTGRISSGAKRGRKGKSDSEGASLTDELLGNMEKASIKYRESDGELTLREVYEWMCLNINKGDDDRTHSSAEQMNDKDAAADSKPELPTYHQFYYYYRTRYGTLSNK